MFSDVSGAYERNAVESAQFSMLLYDGQPGGRFFPYNSTTKLAAAIGYVRAANLEHTTSTAMLPLLLGDRFSIPAQWRGHVAVALQRGFIRQTHKFVPSRLSQRASPFAQHHLPFMHPKSKERYTRSELSALADGFKKETNDLVCR